MLLDGQLFHASRDRKYLLSAATFLVISTLAFLATLIVPGLAILLSLVGFAFCAVWASVRLSSHVASLVLKPTTVPTHDKAVFITGSASGFGFSLAQRLDSLGYKVFAGCRTIDDQRAATLKASCSRNLSLVKIDVSSDTEVAEAVNYVKQHLGNKKLWSLVNNAGVFSLEGIDWGDKGVQNYQRMIDTNAIGAVRVTRAFLPLLKQTQGARVVIAASIAGRIEWPAMAAYSMSKFALRAFGSNLRRELRPFGLYVSLLEPDFYGTPLVDETKQLAELESSWQSSLPEVKATYSKEQVDNVLSSVKALLELTHPDPSPVVDAMVQAVSTSREPEHVVRLCSWAEGYCFYPLEMFPTEFTDDYLLGMPLIIACRILRVVNAIVDHGQDFIKSKLTANRNAKSA